jgi:hypothetical protein
MPHDIFGDRFISYRQPAWHGLGQIVQDALTAEEALEKMGQVYVEAIPLKPAVDLPVTVTQRLLVRRPTTDDPEWVSLGVVSEDYELINPQEFADLWDTSVGKPIETMGFLKRGGLMFITTGLPTIDVAGDEVENYLIAVNGMTGVNGAETRVSPVRVVCQNTLQASAASATEWYKVSHNPNAKELMAEWLSGIYERAERNVEALKSVFEILSAAPVPTAKPVKAAWAPGGKLNEILATTLELAYPYPRGGKVNAPAAVMGARAEYNEYVRKGQDLRRNGALALFEGDGVGMDTPAAKGTLWGLYNAVVETEDYRRGGYTQDNTAFERLFGDRAQTKETAFETCLAFAKGEDPRKIKRTVSVALKSK